MNAAPFLAEVATALRNAGVEVVFVGGATMALYLDAAGAAAARATEDIDCVVNCVVRADYQDIERRLRHGGFAHCLEEDAPICRWVWPTPTGVSVLVDVMPVTDLLGFENRFYPGAVASAEAVVVGSVTIWLPTPGYALATKVAAWLGRGGNDPMGSKDFEDIVALADGCRRLLDSVRQLPDEARVVVAAELGQILARPDSRALVQGMVPQPASAARVEACLAVMRAVAALADQV